MLVTLLTLCLPSMSFAQTSTDSNIVTFNIPSQTLPGALNVFARQARVELVFAERGFDDVQTRAVIGTFRRERALELLLVGTGLRVGYGSGDSVIVQRADASRAIGDTDPEDDDLSMVLLAQTAVDQSRRVVQDTGSVSVSEDQSSAPTSRRRGGEQTEALEEITVTGSRIRGAESASPIIAIGRVDIDRAGFATVEEVLEFLPQNFGAGATVDATDLENALQAIGGRTQARGGGTSVNLRGLGTGSTLILVNGRRLSPGGFESRFTNIGSIPLTAVERVEVMTDGASAIYGSDAIAGVINFVMRSDYDGAETRLRYGSDARGGTSNVQLGQAFGKSWDSGNVLFSYEYYDSEALAASDRAFTASTDLTPFGGTDGRRPGGNPANIVADGQTFAIPAGQDGTSLTAADFDGSRSPNLFNPREFADQMPDIERNSAWLNVTQEVGSVNLFGHARYSKEENAVRFGSVADLIDIPVTDVNPFFVDPTGTGLTEVEVENYSLLNDFGPRGTLGEIESLGSTLGARLDLGNDWHIELVGNWSKEEQKRYFGSTIDRAGILAAANNPDPEMAFNPFGDGSNTNPALIASLVDRSRVFDDSSENTLWSVSINADGALFDSAGGTVRLAAGVDFRDESLSVVEADILDVPDQSRDILAVYGEVFFPIIGESNARPGFRQLEVSLAARFEEYSDFGSTTNPKLGLLWSPSNSLALRSTIGTSYRAPVLRDLDGSRRAGNDTFYFPQLFVDFGLAPFPFLVLNGANEELRPEEAVTWTAGFQWRPERIRGLSFDVTYFNVDFDDRIGSPVGNVFVATTDPNVASLVTLNPTLDQITAIVNDPRYFLGSPTWPFNVPAEDLISGVAPVGAIVNARRVNSSQLLVTGAELQMSYDFDTNIGAFSLDLNANYLFDFKRRIVPSDPLVEEVDTLGRPVDLRARAGVNYSRGSWVVSSFVNYTDGYTDRFSDPVRGVDSWTTIDLTIAYTIGEGAGFLNDTRLALTTQNLLNEDPPFVDTIGGVGYDATNANPLGQFFALQITKDW